VTTTLKRKTIYLLKKLCSSSSTASTGDCESHHVLFILWLITTKEDTLHLELVLQCFNSLHLDEWSTTEDTLRVKAVIDDNNNNNSLFVYGDRQLPKLWIFYACEIYMIYSKLCWGTFLNVTEPDAWWASALEISNKKYILSTLRLLLSCCYYISYHSNLW